MDGTRKGRLQEDISTMLLSQPNALGLTANDANRIAAWLADGRGLPDGWVLMNSEHRMTTVYVATQGLYEDRSVSGIYDSPERAMAAHPGDRWRKTTWTGFPNQAPGGGPDLTTPSHWVSWENELDWASAVSITAMEIVDTGPERPVDEAVVQTYREPDGHWDYLPEPAALAAFDE